MRGEGSNSDQQWTAEQRTAVALRVIRGEISLEEAARSRRVSIEKIESWKEEFLVMAEKAALSPPTNRETEGEAPGRRTHGVWICENNDESLAPVLFIEAACPDSFPLVASARWVGVGPPPKAFRQTDEVPLLRGRCRPSGTDAGCIDLLGARMFDAVVFEKTSVLSDWAFPVQINAAVLLLSKEKVSDSTNWFSRTVSRAGNRTIAWLKRQELPFVIAAMGYRASEFSRGQLAQIYGLPIEVPILSGPALTRAPRSTTDRAETPRRDRFSIAAFLRAGHLRFDSDYAQEILAAVHLETLRKALGSRDRG